MHKYTFFIFKSLLQCESSFTKPLNLKSKGISMYFHVFRIHLPHQKRSLATPKTTLHQLHMHRFTVLPVNLVVATIHQHLEILLAYFQLASDRLHIRPAFFWHPQKNIAKPKQQWKPGKITRKSRTSQPAIKNVWLRFWYVLISVSFVHALKHEVVFVDPQPRPSLSLLKAFLCLFYDLWGAVVTQKRPHMSTKNNTHANITYVILWYLICVSFIISFNLCVQIYWLQCL